MKKDSYTLGYSDGYHDVAFNTEHLFDEEYTAGFEDGRGDREAGAETVGVKSPFTDPAFYANNDPPEGYIWAEDYRTPLKGEVYLTKAGNAGVAKNDPKNGRQRHMLKAIKGCSSSDYYHHSDKFCQFALGHSGKCSYQLVK